MTTNTNLLRQMARAGNWSAFLALANVTPGINRSNGTGKRANAQMADVPFDVWEGASPFYSWPTGSEDLEIVSTSAEDSETGTGAQVVRIGGVDGDKFKSTTVTMTGTTPVRLWEPLRQVNRIGVVRSGPLRKAAGKLTVRRVSDGVVRGIVEAGGWTSRQPMMRVPADKHMLLLSVITNVSNVPAQVQTLDYTIELFTRPPMTSAPPLSVTVVPGTALVPPVSLDYPIPITTLPAGVDFSLICTHLTANGPTIYASWTGLLLDPRFFE